MKKYRMDGINKVVRESKQLIGWYGPSLRIVATRSGAAIWAEPAAVKRTDACDLVVIGEICRPVTRRALMEMVARELI